MVLGRPRFFFPDFAGVDPLIILVLANYQYGSKHDQFVTGEEAPNCSAHVPQRGSCGTPLLANLLIWLVGVEGLEPSTR